MLVITLIATIIHLNMGFEFWEALGRGFVSAIMVGILAGVGSLIIYIVGSFIGWVKNTDRSL